MLSWNAVKSRASALGIADPSSDRTTLIRQIQAAEGNTACFKIKTACGEMKCCWRNECIAGNTARFSAYKSNG